MKTSELTGAALNWAVATALGRGPKYNMESHGRTWRGWWLAGPGYDYEPMPSYSSDWSQGGPIIERIKGFLFKHWLESNREGQCQAEIHNYDGDWIAFGPTPLIAGMRCYVASKLGDDVDLPKGFTN